MLPRHVETLAELAECVRQTYTTRDRLRLLGSMVAVVDTAIGATVAQIPCPERDWADIAKTLGVASADAARGLYDPDGALW